MKVCDVKCIELYLAWFLACVGTVGSLYVSEILGYPPCSLCWAQRICLFPLVWILGLAAWENHLMIGRYVKGLPLIGAGFALFQLSLLLHRFEGSCSKTCSAPLVWDLHIWIPIGSLVNFVIIFFFLQKSSKN